MKTTFACKNCGSTETRPNPFRFSNDELVVNTTCSKCHDKAIVDSGLARAGGFANLHNAICGLNVWDFTQLEDGEIFATEPMYEFKYKVDGKHIKIYDNNEFFNMNLDEEIRCICYEGAKEFGAKYTTPESTIDKVLGKLKEALKADLKKDVVIEWEDNITLSVWF